MADCTCGRIQVGTTESGPRNWNESCPEHGIDSEWYRTVGRAKFQAQRERLGTLQRQAREARARGAELEKLMQGEE